MTSSRRRTVRLVEVILLVLVIVSVTAVLLPILSTTRYALGPAELMPDRVGTYEHSGKFAFGDTAVPVRTAQARPDLADVKDFNAEITLTPRLSVGTARPESIYEASFAATITATNPNKSGRECEILLPLPPQIISLSDLNVSVNGEPSQSISLREDMLVWHGHIDPEQPASFDVRYAAVGKGIYTLQKPPGKIIESFKATVTANRSDIRMLELSLQPVAVDKQPGKTVYRWEYSNLVLGRPIALDVLGVAPIDQLGELVWLGPVSVLIFGILVVLLALAYRPERLDRWMILLIVGTFAGGFPLMYFAQELLSLPAAMLMAALAVLAIIAVRSVTLLGTWVGIVGVVGLAGATLAATLVAAIHPVTQGVVLTAAVIGVLVAAMILLPKAQKALAAAPGAPPAEKKQEEIQP